MHDTERRPVSCRAERLNGLEWPRDWTLCYYSIYPGYRCILITSVLGSARQLSYRPCWPSVVVMEHRIRISFKKYGCFYSFVKHKKKEWRWEWIRRTTKLHKTTNQVTPIWPKYLMAKSTNENSLTKLSPFKPAKSNNEITKSKIANVTILNNNFILLETNNCRPVDSWKSGGSSIPAHPLLPYLHFPFPFPLSFRSRAPKSS